VRLNGPEKAPLALALAFVVLGFFVVTHPFEGMAISPGSPSVKGLGTPARVEHVSKSRSRVYGWVSVAMGIGIGWLTLRPGRR